MSSTYSFNILICKVLFYVNGVQEGVIVTHNSIIYSMYFKYIGQRRTFVKDISA